MQTPHHEPDAMATEPVPYEPPAVLEDLPLESFSLACTGGDGKPDIDTCGTPQS